MPIPRRVLRWMPAFCISIIGFTSRISHAEPDTCTYRTYSWNTVSRQAVHQQVVHKSYRAVTAEERDLATGCTVCEEDQQVLIIKQLPPVTLCKKLVDKYRAALEQGVDQGQTINELTGYRPGRTKGGIDAEGNRLLFSNHAYGVALDVNTSANGLYDQCVKFDQQCRLVKGGKWDARQPLSLHAQSPLVKAMHEQGLLWGGQIEGYQKDFMHFSPSGY